MSEQPIGGIGDVASYLRDEAVWLAPPDGLYDRIAGEVEVDSRAGGRRWGWTIFAAAAAIAAVFAVGFAIGGAGRDDEPANADDPLVAELVLVGTDLAPEAAATVEVFDRGAGYALILDTSGLAPAEGAEYYEGWLRSAAGDEVSVGTFHMRGGDDTVVLWSGVPIEEFPTVVVTREKVGGAVTGDEVMTGTIG
jgi:hypothetical protein